MSRLLALFVTSLLLGGAFAQNTSPTAADCNRSVRHCDTCRYQFFRGTTTKAICTKCETGYLAKASGRACYCAPGFFTNETTAVPSATGFTCYPCGKDNYCPGSKITAASSTARSPCGANKQTTTDYAMSELECTVLPGYGWDFGDLSAECPIGMYNPGFNARKCTPCAGGLTTSATKSLSSQDCVAGKGFYYLRGKAVACARGTYKNSIANQDCDKCPTGISTANNTVSAIEATECTVLLPGYEITAGATVGVTNATECPVNTYRADESALTSSATSCTPCPDGLVTLPNVTRSTTLDACVVPPGFGWSATGSTTAGSATICSIGSYNPGYNRQPCVACGSGILTDAPGGAINADACYTPAGYGNIQDAVTSAFSALICPVGTYGRPNNTYGLVNVECTKCMDHSTTATAGATSQALCLVEPGYGWNDGQVLECEYGYYNLGGNQNLCTYCGDGYNTSAIAGAMVGEMKSNASSTCQVDFGFYTSASGIEACLRGMYKDTLGNTSPSTSSCLSCPRGTSTTKRQAALLRSDCDTCKPGFGLLSGVITLSNPGCDRCAAGTYSSGFVYGGQTCAACPKPAGYSGSMVSREGVFTPEDCYNEFLTDANVFDNTQAWDVIPMGSGATPSAALVFQAAFGDVSSCQTNCAAGSGCQYFAFYNEGGPSGQSGCYFRITTAPIPAYNSESGTLPSSPLVAFEIREGQYAVYPALANEDIGVPLEAADGSARYSPTSLMSAKSHCDADRECVGMYGPDGGLGNTWTVFGAAKREGVIGKIRVIGGNIQSWVPLPTGL